MLPTPSPEVVALFSTLLQAHGVPLWVSHPEVQACSGRLEPSALGVRAFFTLAALGMRHPHEDSAYFGSGGEKRFASDLLLQWDVWRRRRRMDLVAAARPDDAKALAGLTPEEAAACMLRALEAMAMACEAISIHKREEMRGYDWVGWAARRLAGLLAQWANKARGGQDRPVAFEPVRGQRISATDPRWAKVSQSLAAGGKRGDRLLLMYFEHVFHATTGIWQVALDDSSRHPASNQFYESEAGLLRHACTEPALRDAAERLSRELEKTPRFTGQSDPALRQELRDLALRSPPCFNVCLGFAAPNLEDTLSQVAEPVAQGRLRAAHQLAEMMALQLLDPLALRGQRGGEVPGFCWDDVAYAAHRCRYRQQAKGKLAVFEQITKRFRHADDPYHIDPPALEACEGFRRQMAAYFTYLSGPPTPPRTEAAVRELVRLHVPRECRPPWPSAAAEPRPCAMCRVCPR